MSAVLKILSKIYGFAVTLRNRSYDSGKIKTYSLYVPAISVGSIAAGGTAKTPVAVKIVELLKKIGKNPALAALGYKRESKGVIAVSDGKKILVSPEIAGDEPWLAAKKTGVPVTVGEKKYEAALYAEYKFPIDCLVIDDGFQHRKLERDLDLVILDEKSLNDELIPAGRLREPLESLRRADAIILLNETNPEKISRFLKKEAFLLRAKTKISRLYDLLDGKNVALKNEKLCAVAFCGIAKPERFFESLENIGIELKAKKKFPDHYAFKKRDVEKLIEISRLKNSVLIATEKDAVKLEKFGNLFAKQKVRVLIAEQIVDFGKDESVLLERLENLFKNEVEDAK